VTNRVLGYLAPVRRPLRISTSTCDWLATLGAVLQKANLKIAAEVDCLVMTGPSLDGAIVSWEQSIVETQLLATRDAQPEVHGRLLSELRLLLNRRHWSGLSHLNSEVYRYCSVLMAVRDALSCPLDFGSHPHRVAIGMALIAELSHPGSRTSLASSSSTSAWQGPGSGHQQARFLPARWRRISSSVGGVAAHATRAPLSPLTQRA